jgi:uncharacterized protein
MKVALIGSTGFVGSALLQELLQRGHTVTALARQPAKLAAQERLHVVQADAQDAAQVAQAVEGHEAVLSAYNPGWSAPDLYDAFLRGSTAITQGVKRAGVKRLLVVGGAGSLYVAPGLQLVDTPDFPKHVPPEVVPGARAARDALAAMAQETELDWTFVSPPAMLQPGERTGQYRLGTDQLLMDGDKPAGISVKDLAVALVDELETPRHSRRRFTVAS